VAEHLGHYTAKSPEAFVFVSTRELNRLIEGD